MLSPEFFVKTLSHLGVEFYAGVPDSLLKNVCAYITDNIPENCNIITANEGTAVGLASGYYLATSKLPMVYMQNSGIGNAVNPLLSLADQKVYSIPMLLMIGWRGEPGVHDEPQHVTQGELTLDLLDTMHIPYAILPTDENEALEVLTIAANTSIRESRPYALVVKKDTFSSYKLNCENTAALPLNREEALKLICGELPSDTIIVSTTGKLSRELYEYRDETATSHASDFLTVGSMGHSSSIALGIALNKPHRNVVCLDGDGAFLMHMGAISNIGDLGPANFIHIIFNNGAHESVGAQPTLGFKITIPLIAMACGYKFTATVESPNEIIEALQKALSKDGPSLIEIRVGIQSRDNLGRPKTSPKENKIAFMDFVAKN